MPSRVRFKNWNPNGVISNIEKEVERRMTAVGMEIQSTAVRKLNVGQPVRRTKGGHLVGLAPSAPGEPPKTLSARLKQSVAFAVSRDFAKIALRVGTNVVYGRRLELGFHGRDKKGRNISQEARPWLRVSVEESRRAIQRIFRAD